MLNTEWFLLLAGDPSTWDAEFIDKRDDADYDICQIQASQWERGHRIAELASEALGWCVRSGLGFNGWERYSRYFSTRDEAIKWGTDWANEDPKRREFIARKNLLR